MPINTRNVRPDDGNTPNSAPRVVATGNASDTFTGTGLLPEDLRRFFAGTEPPGAAGVNESITTENPDANDPRNDQLTTPTNTNPNNPTAQTLPSQQQPQAVPSQRQFSSLSPRPYFPLQTQQNRYDFYFGRKVLPTEVTGPLIGDRNSYSPIDPIDAYGGSGRFSEDDRGTGGTLGTVDSSTYEAATGDGTGNITYRLSGATRNQPPSAQLESILDTAAKEAGVDLVVFSAGQDARGTPNARRVGSTRHDSGRAVDVWVYSEGTRISTANPNPILSKFIASCVANGAKGIGAGPGYMDSVGVHVDVVGGDDGGGIMWGANNSSATTPQYVRAAYAAGQEGTV